MTERAHADHHLKVSILAELDWLPSIEADRIAVALDDGAVTLSGQVRTYPEKYAAVRAAFRVAGVTAVADEIEVRSARTPRRDTDIARDAAGVLAGMADMAVTPVQAEVRDRVVTLTGSVSWQYERVTIEHAVSTLRGVREVRDHITLRPTSHVSPSVAKVKIAAALRRSASIRAENISIDVHGDKVTLSGDVGTWAEHAEAGRAAWSTPGVVEIENDLHVTH